MFHNNKVYNRHNSYRSHVKIACHMSILNIVLLVGYQILDEFFLFTKFTSYKINATYFLFDILGLVATVNLNLSNRYPNRTIQPRKTYNSLNFEYNWTYGLCDCCSDCRLCCLGLWCLPCLQCVLFTDAREYICTYIKPKSLGNLRSKIRGSYRIKGQIDKDAMAAICCPCCATIQMKRELMAQGEI